MRAVVILAIVAGVFGGGLYLSWSMLSLFFGS